MNNTWSIILGALIALIGGILGDEFRSWRERGGERKAIKSSICDELTEIESITINMHEVWEKSKILYPSYVADLLGSTSIYESYRTRLFLIEDEKIRKDLVNFYKKLKDLAQKSAGKLGTLAETSEASLEQTNFAGEFKKLGDDATSLKGKLKS